MIYKFYMIFIGAYFWKFAYEDEIKILQNNEYVVLDSNGKQKYKKKYISKTDKLKRFPYKKFENQYSGILKIYDLDGYQIAEKKYLNLEKISNGIFKAEDKYYESSTYSYKRYWGYINQYGKWIWNSK